MIPSIPQFSFELTKTGNKEEDQLLQACNRGRINDIKQGLKNNPIPLNFWSPEGITPLMLIVFKGNDKSFQLILKNSSKESVYHVDKAGRNALHYACASNQVLMVRKLYQECQLDILIDSKGLCAAEYANPSAVKIDELLHKATQDKLDNNGLILKRIYDKSQGDVAQMQELSQHYGLPPVKISPMQEWEARGEKTITISSEQRSKLKEERKANMQDSATRKKIVEHFISYPPNSVEIAIGYVWSQYGVKATEESMKALMQYADKKRIAASNPV